MFKPSSKKICSLQNPLIKRLVKLRQSKDFREDEGSVLVMGTKIIEEMLLKVTPKALFVEEGEKLISDLPYTILTKEVAKKVTGLPSFVGSIAEFELPKPSSLKGKKWILACDEIKDPGNLGTLVRSCLAFGWEGLFLLPGCCDLFNDKVIRASRGGVFFLPFYYGFEKELQMLCEKGDVECFIADIAGEKLEEVKNPKKAVLLLGNESKGPSSFVEQIGKKITIPMQNHVESLNVAIAGSILMHKLKN